jgi:hypothetical protein
VRSLAPPSIFNLDWSLKQKKVSLRKKNDSVVVGTCVVMMFYKHMSDKSREAVSSCASIFSLICTFSGFGNEYFLGDWVDIEENDSIPERKRTLLQRSHGVRTFDS